MPGNPPRPALFPFGVRLELEVEPLTALLGTVPEVPLGALLAGTEEVLGELSSSATATDGVEVGAVEAVELRETAPWEA